ncbi:NVEALA domain-containing protein [uncultured Bacteroides sp.]|uniref:NVEALA domain-containing protein n=1 Tax=uncultured Bacteroides sp. TaxID=162156 RepID=UPI002614A231|nr:NVEALA domain-containing protein [uncultured Bacteroides sp.]
MKRISLLSLIVVVAMVIGLISKKEDLPVSDLMLANIEALASYESGGSALNCWQTINSTGSSLPTHVTYCLSCSAQLARRWSGSSSCTSH